MPPQVPNPREVSQRGSDLIEKLASFEMPSQSDYVNSLDTMHAGLAIVLLVCGLIYLLHGWKTFKLLVIVNAGVLGGFLGNQFGQILRGPNMPLFGGIAGALLFAVLAWPLMKFGVGLMGGLAGGFLGYGVWNYVAGVVGKSGLKENAWAGAVIGLIALGLLAFLVFRLVVMVFTSVQGSLMAVSGICAMLMNIDPLQAKLYAALSSNAHLLMLLIGVPALIGFACQYTAMAKKAKKKKKAMEGDS